MIEGALVGQEITVRLCRHRHTDTLLTITACCSCAVRSSASANRLRIHSQAVKWIRRCSISTTTYLLVKVSSGAELGGGGGPKKAKYRSHDAFGTKQTISSVYSQHCKEFGGGGGCRLVTPQLARRPVTFHFLTVGLPFDSVQRQTSTV
jgi:hypothetical protein